MPKDRYEIDASQAERAIKGLRKAQADLGKETESTGTKLTKAERLAERFARQADPTKRYEKQMRDLAIAVDRGGLSLTDANVNALRYQKSLEQMSQAGKRAFGPSQAERMASVAASLGSITLAGNGVRSLFSAINEEAGQSVQRLRESIDAIGELQQLSYFEANKQAARDLVARGIVDNASQGAGLIFQLSSSGIRGKDREFILDDVAASKIVASENLSTFAAKVKKSQDSLGLGSLPSAVNKLLQTSEATDTDVTSIAEASTLFGSQVQALGFRGDAGLAALATILKRAPNQNVAANQFAALLTAIDKGDLKRGGSLQSTIVGIAEQVRAGEDVNELLGNVRAVRGFRNLSSQLPEFARQTQLISTAPGRDILGERAGKLRQDPTFNAVLALDEATGAADVALEDRFGRGRALVDAIAQRRVEFAAKNSSALAVAAQSSFAPVVDRLLVNTIGPRATIQDSLNIERAIEQRTGGEGRFSQEFEAQLLQYTENMAESTRRTAEAAEQMAANAARE